MRLAAFNFKKISIERLTDSFRNAKINTKINISDIEVIDSEVIREDEGLVSVTYSYEIDYDPDMAKINLEGRILLVVSKEKAKEIKESWKKNKMSEAFRITLFNIILRKSNIKALELEEEMGFPPHIPLPSLKRPKEE